MPKRKDTPAPKSTKTPVWFQPGSAVPEKLERLKKLIAQELPAAVRTDALSNPKIVEIALDEALARRAGKR